MSERFESDVMGDLFEDEAEGSSRFEEFDEDAYEEDAGESDEFLSRIVSGIGQAIGGQSSGDEFMEMDEWEAGAGDEFEMADSMEDAVADALEAEDADEFFRRLRGVARRFGGIARRVGRGVGQVARVIAPIASAIPLPQTQAIGRLAGIAGRLLADGADEFEAVDELLDLAEEEDSIDAAAPVVAALTLRRTMPNVHLVPRQERRRLVRSVSNATRTLARQHGPHAARAVPRIVQTAQRAVRQRRIPARALPQVVRQTAARVARSPQAVRRLAGSRASGGARRYGSGTASGGGRGACSHCGRRRVYVLRGPVELTIQGR